MFNYRFICQMLLVLMIAQGGMVAAGNRSRYYACPCYPTRFQLGELLVEVVGKERNSVEAYWHNEVFTQKFADSHNIHINGIHLSKGDQGLFVIRPSAQQVTLVGWRENFEPKSVNQSTHFGDNTIKKALPHNAPIHVEWKTDQILRISQWNEEAESACFLRFKNNAWYLKVGNGAWKQQS